MVVIATREHDLHGKLLRDTREAGGMPMVRRTGLMILVAGPYRSSGRAVAGCRSHGPGR